MQALFDIINAICEKIQIVSDLFWSFPTNLDWYANIPILGNFSLAIILLIGSGVYFTCSLRFIQVRKFKEGLRILKNSKATETGISPLAAFFLSTAMRVGPGNILGVTGAIATGGPGALFWMWVSAFFGMATAYTESTLAQIFKEKKDNEYLGGLAFYGKRLLKGSAVVGAALSIIYIVYALLCFPAQGFNTISAVGQIAETVAGQSIATDSALYWISFAILMIISVIVSFGGIKKLTKVTDITVPIMAVIYVLTVLVLIIVLIVYFIKYSEENVEYYYDNSTENSYLRNYGVNEYIPVYVEEADVVIKYLNDFKNAMIADIEYAYSLLNENYRVKRFGNVGEFSNYVNKMLSLSTYTMEVETYKVVNSNGSKFFDVYDMDGNHYIFKEKSIMDYEVYLDNYTVEIK